MIRRGKAYHELGIYVLACLPRIEIPGGMIVETRSDRRPEWRAGKKANRRRRSKKGRR